MEKTRGLYSVGELTWKCDRKTDTGGGIKSNQVKLLGYINCFSVSCGY